jgi:hypothetical protein
LSTASKGKPDKPITPKPETGNEKSGLDHEELQSSGEVNQSPEYQVEPDTDRLTRLELWVHRENLNIPAGNDARLEAARTMLRELRGFTVPNEFIRDIHAMLQSLFQADLDAHGKAEPETAIDAASLDILGADHEE